MTRRSRRAPSCVPDDPSPLDACRRAAEAGDACAQYQLGLRLMQGDGVDRDPARAVAWLLKAARSGLAQAQYRLGLAYEAGDGVRQSYPRALHWLRKAALQNMHDALYAVGQFWLLGLGVPADRRKAVRWLTPAAQGGHDGAQLLLGLVLSHDASTLDDALVWLRSAADRGHCQAILRLAVIHDDALGPCHDPDAAHALYLEAARRRSAAACLNLGGRAAQDGNEVEAYKWWTLALRYAGPADDQIAWIGTQNLGRLTCAIDAAVVEEAERRIVEWTRH